MNASNQGIHTDALTRTGDAWRYVFRDTMRVKISKLTEEEILRRYPIRGLNRGAFLTSLDTLIEDT